MNVNFNNSMNILDTSSKSRPREVVAKERDDAPLRKKSDQTSAFERELSADKKPAPKKEKNLPVNEQEKNEPKTREVKTEKLADDKKEATNNVENSAAEEKKDSFTAEEKAKFEQRREDRKAVKPLKNVIKEVGDISAKSPVLALLTGKLENLSPQDIPSLVSSNQFISEAIGTEEITNFLEEERDIGELAEMLSIPAMLVHQAIDQGLNPLEKVTPEAFLKALNVDPGRVGSELSLLRENVALEGLKGYMQRAEKLAGGLTKTPTLSKEEVYTKLASQMGRAQNHQMVEQMSTQAAPKQHPMMSAIAGLLNKKPGEPIDSGEAGPRFVQIEQPVQTSRDNIGDGFSPIGLPGEELPSKFFEPKDKAVNYEAIIGKQGQTADISGNKTNSLRSSNALPGPNAMGEKISNILAGANAIMKMNGAEAQKSLTQPISMSQDMGEILSENKIRQDIALDQVRNNSFSISPDMGSMKPTAPKTMTVNQLIDMDNFVAEPVRDMASDSVDDFVAESSDVESFLGDRSSRFMLGDQTNNMSLGRTSPVLGTGFKMALHETSSDNFRASLIDKAQAHIAAGSSKANFSLTTPELGQVNLSMSLEGDKLDLKMMSGSQQVRDMLAIEIPKLKEALQDQNIQLQDVNVGVDSETTSEFAQGHAGERQREIFEQFNMNRKNATLSGVADTKSSAIKSINPMNAMRANHHNGQFVAMA